MRLRPATLALAAAFAAAAVLAGYEIFAGGNEAGDASAASGGPAMVEPVEGSELSRLTLSQKAIERLGLRTVAVREAGRGTAVPYGALIYQPDGSTWVYTNPSPRVFVRAEVEIDRIAGDRVFIADGPPAGSRVVSVAAAELWGTEFEVGH